MDDNGKIALSIQKETQLTQVITFNLDAGFAPTSYKSRRSWKKKQKKQRRQQLENSFEKSMYQEIFSNLCKANLYVNKLESMRSIFSRISSR